MDKIKLINVETYAFASRNELLDYISIKKKILVAVNAEKILNNNEKLYNIINENIGYPDGIGAVLALKRKGLDSVKIPGAEFWLDIINRFYTEKTFYLIGSSQEVINNTVIKLKQDFKDINIVGYRDGFLDDTAKEELTKTLTELKPDIVFVAQGTPRQEYLMDELIKIHPALYMGLGGSFDLYTGKVKPVPEWWKKIFKWEGLYRCMNDFSNIDRWKRQPAVPILLTKIILGKI